MRSIVHIVVVAFLFLAVAGLVVVFVGRLRASANRARCTNNLREIGVALHGYNATNGFPPAGTLPNPDLPPEQRLSWYVELLPYDKNEDLYRRIDQTKGWEADANRAAVNTVIPTFVCPANFSGVPPDSPGPAHYIGIAGLGKDVAVLPLSDPKAGFFGYDRTYSFADAQRGVTFTIVSMETASENGPWAAGGWPTVRGLDPARRPYLGPGHQFGGIHQGGAFTLFADLSVQFLNDSMSERALEGMSTLSPSVDWE